MLGFKPHNLELSLITHNYALDSLNAISLLILAFKDNIHEYDEY